MYYFVYGNAPRECSGRFCRWSSSSIIVEKLIFFIFFLYFVTLPYGCAMNFLQGLTTKWPHRAGSNVLESFGTLFYPLNSVGEQFYLKAISIINFIFRIH